VSSVVSWRQQPMLVARTQSVTHYRSQFCAF